MREYLVHDPNATAFWNHGLKPAELGRFEPVPNVLERLPPDVLLTKRAALTRRRAWNHERRRLQAVLSLNHAHLLPCRVFERPHVRVFRRKLLEVEIERGHVRVGRLESMVKCPCPRRHNTVHVSSISGAFEAQRQLLGARGEGLTDVRRMAREALGRKGVIEPHRSGRWQRESWPRRACWWACWESRSDRASMHFRFLALAKERLHRATAPRRAQLLPRLDQPTLFFARRPSRVLMRDVTGRSRQF